MRLYWVCLSLGLLVCACEEGSGDETKGIQHDSVAVEVSPDGHVDTVHTGAESNDDVVDDGSWTYDAQSASHDGAGIAVVHDVREAEHEGYDRIVIEFRDGILPGYSVRHPTEKIIECGSGHDVDLESSRALEIRFEPARGYTEEGRSTVTHADRSPKLPAIKEVRVICDFEAMFTIAAGTAERLPFRVSTLQNPARLVVDVRHASL